MAQFTKKLTSAQCILLGFALVILTGTFLLMLPLSTVDHRGSSFEDALFTATSAVCVTGLIVQDTATYWSGFGQAVLLALIQIGGMGVITVVMAITLLSGKQISLKSRSTMQDSVSAPKVGGIVRFTAFFFKWILLFELVGMAVMVPVFSGRFGFRKGCWYALFHSVSAFCNAGFDLMGVKEPFSSLTSFVSDPVLNLAIMGLIVTGGIGFLTWDDLRTNRIHIRRYRMQTKVVLVMSVVLILLPALYYFFFELGELNPVDRVWAALFQSVTPRTAGFNTVDLRQISDTGLTVMIGLMLTGGSPGSTAGGMKTTTVAVLVCTAVSVFRKEEHTHFFGRRIPDKIVRNAAAVVVLYLTLFLSGGILICRIENLPLLDCLFETASALATVGLTLGVTTKLGMVSKGILIFLMYAGRVGGLTLIDAARSGRQGNTSRLPEEKLTVG